MKRDALSYPDAIMRIDARNLSPIMEKCDFVIENNGEILTIEKEIEDFILKCAGKDIFAK